MDPNLVYGKTASGEEAMRQRTRVVQRNLRMVLILVDGKATVAELCVKAGNTQLAENALRDLEQDGFIAPMGDQDSLWAQSAKVAQEIRDAQNSGAGERAAPPAPTRSMRTPSAFPMSRPLRPQPLNPSVAHFSISPTRGGPASVIESISIFGVPNTCEEVVPSAPSAVRADKPRTPFDKFKALFSGGRKNPADDAGSSPVYRNTNRLYISWPLAVTLGTLALLVLLALTALLFPYSRYLPNVEAALAASAGQPVRIGAMSVSFYPKPGLLLENVQLGEEGSARSLRVAELRLLPALGTLASSRVVFHDATLSGMQLPAEAIAGLSGIFERLAQASSRVGVQHVTLEKVELALRGLGFSDMAGEFKLDADSRFQALSLHAPNHSLRLEAKVVDKGLDLDLEAYSWRPTPNSLYIFDSASIKGKPEGEVLTLNKMEVRIFDGLVQGALVLQAGGKPVMGGDISFERISAKRFGGALGIGGQLDGELGGKLKFSASAATWPDIFSGLDGAGDFTLHRGSMSGIDLAEAMRHESASPVRGGTTRFEQLSGRLRLTPESYRFSALQIASGLMQSSGQIEVRKDLSLNGVLDVQMRGTVNQLRAPVTLSGTLKAPLVQVGRR